MGRRLVAALAATASLLSASAVLAQESHPKDRDEDAASSGQLETIVVTARKQTESLQDVPVAVVAISEAALQRNLANDLSKIAELAPQVSIGRSVTGTGAVITIRGISSAAVDSGIDQSVSFSLDGVSMSRGRIIQTAMFDMQQVEVMQGPQALFFGKNSPAGVISISSADPTSSFEGYVRVGYEFNAKEKYVEAAMSGPLSDNFSARLAGRFSDMKGWIKNVSTPMENPFQPFAPLPGALQGKTGPDGHDLAARLSLVWEPSDDFAARFKATYSSQRSNSNSAYAELFCFGGTTTVPVTLGVPQPGADCEANQVKAESALPPELAVNFPYANGGIPYLKSDMGLVSLELNKSFGNLELVSTTGYYNQLHRGANDADFSAFVQIYGSERERYEMINQEIRLNSDFSGPFNFMIGGYFEHSSRKWLNAPAVLYFLNPATESYVTTVATSDSSGDSFSLFGQLRWEILPDLELAGGARYSHDKKKGTFLNLQNNPAAPFLGLFLYPEGVPLDSRYSDDNVSPEITLTWKPTPNQTVYAAYKTGYKAGGISNPALIDASFTAENLKFGPEKVRGFEAGYKADLFDRTVRLNLTAYRYKYKGLQVTAYDPVAIRYSIRNAASSRTTGFSALIQWLATENLSFDGSLGYNRAKYLNFPAAQCYAGQTPALGCVNGVQDLSGKKLNRAPEVTFSAGGEYTADIGDWTAALSVNAAYSSSYQTATDYGPGGFQSSFWRLNAALRVRTPDENLEFAVIGRNLTDSYYKVVTYTASLGNPDQYSGFFNRPREVAVQMEYKF